MIEIDYTNWRGERSLRRIRPTRFYFGETAHHKRPQWLVEAYDYGKKAYRTFALADVHRWEQLDS